MIFISAQKALAAPSSIFLASRSVLEYCSTGILPPFGKPFVFTVLPKLIGGLFLSIAATLAYRALRRCKVARPLPSFALRCSSYTQSSMRLPFGTQITRRLFALFFALLSERLVASRNLPNRIALASAALCLQY